MVSVSSQNGKMNGVTTNEYSMLVDNLQRANRAVLEANFLVKEMHLSLEQIFLSLEIPVDNFKPKLQKKIRCKPFVYMCENNKRIRCISIDEFEHLLSDAREALRNEEINRDCLFGFNQPHPTLIGVCNLSLRPLLYDIRFSYSVSVFGTQGEVIGYLKCELKRLNTSDGSSCEVKVREINDVPSGFSNFVFCQYTFPCADDSTFVLPLKQFAHLSALGAINFNHTASFRLKENLVLSNILTIEIWGHKRASSSRHSHNNSIDNNSLIQQISDKWKGSRCFLMLSVGLNELNENGIWNSVSRHWDPAVSGCGGFYKLKQGQSHVFRVCVKDLRSSGSLAITLNRIDKIEVGCIRCCKSTTSGELDSYTDEDLCLLREMWLKKLEIKRQSIQKQIAESNEANEQCLIDNLISVTEERNIVELPPAGSGIPGSPADWNPPPGVEKHTPLLLLSNRSSVDIPIAAERADEFITLSSFIPTEVTPTSNTCSSSMLHVQCHWDAATHESAWLNQISDPDLFVFLIMRIHVNLQIGISSSPKTRTVILRKRIPVQIVKRNANSSVAWMSKLLPTVGSSTSTRSNNLSHDIGVIYDLIHEIPSSILESEPREKIARLAAQSVRGIKSISEESGVLSEYLTLLQSMDDLLDQDQNHQALHLNKLLRHAGKDLNDIVPVINEKENSLTSNRNDIRVSSLSLRSNSSAGSDKTIKAIKNSDEENQVIPTSVLATAHVKEDVCKKTNNEENYSLPCPPTLNDTKLLEWPTLGQNVQVLTNSINCVMGIVKYIGPTKIREGIWVGVELNDPVGKHNGNAKGIQYFVCKPNHGVFVRPDKLRRVL